MVACTGSCGATTSPGLMNGSVFELRVDEPEIDMFTAPRFYADTLEKVAARVPAYAAGTVMLDMQYVSFMDCAGLRALMLVRHEVASRGCDLRLSNPRPQILKLLNLTGTAPDFLKEPFGQD